MKPGPLFHIQREGTEAGPYDVVQMAGLLRRKIIDADTPTRRSGDDAWKPFGWQPEFVVAREMPADAVSSRTVELDEEAGTRAAGPLPLPSAETVLKLVGFAVAVVLAFVAAFALAWLSPELGKILAVAGAGAILIGQAMVLVRVFDAEGQTALFYYLVPGYDIYFLAMNFWELFPWMSLKYVGAAVCIGAALGMGQV